MPLSAPSTPTFATPIDDAGTTVATARTVGATTLVVADGSSFGTPSPSAPVRLTCVRAFDGLIVNLKATGRSGNTLTVAVADGTTDLALAVGDTVDVTDSAAALADIHAAVLTSYTSLAGLVGAVNANTTAIALRAPIDSAAFTGTPSAPTPSIGDNSTRLATTEWVTEQGYLGGIPSTLVAHVTLNTPSVLYATPVTFSVSGGTATGTLTLNTQAANTVLAGPATGANAAPTMRALVAADLPAHDASLVTSGTLAVARGGTGLSTVASGKLLYTSALDTLAPLTLGTNLSITSGTLNAASGGASLPSTTSLFKGDGSGGAAAATAGSDYAYPGNNFLNGIITFARIYGANSPGINKFVLDSYGPSFALSSDMPLSWGSGTNLGGATSGDAGFGRAAAGVVQVTDGSTGLGDLLLRSPIIRRNSAPADSELVAGDMALWLDATNGASALKIKAKSANGTVVTGSVTLS